MLVFWEVIFAKNYFRGAIKLLQLLQDDPLRRRFDISIAKKVLKWEPTIDLETGLKKTIMYFKEKLGE